MDPPKNGTAVYDPVTRTAQTATFDTEATLEGRDVYNYKVDAGGPITSPGILAQFKDFPKQLPKAAVAGLLQVGMVPEQSRALIATALPSLPDLVSVDFTSTNLINLAVDRQFGAPLKVDQTRRLYVSIPVDGKDVPTLPLSTVKLHTADSEVVAAAHTLEKNAKMLSVLRLWLPTALLVVGIVLAALGVIRWRKPAAAKTTR